nr:thiamine pyrophosphate-dependent enzyme [Gammaproteobacteria bacterium]
MSAELDLLKASSALASGNAAFLDALYEQYLENPETIPAHWRSYFDQLPGKKTLDRPHARVIQKYQRLSREKISAYAHPPAYPTSVTTEQQAAVLQLINGYRFRGHQLAKLDPLELRDRPYIADVDLQTHQLDKVDLNSVFNTGSLYAPDRLPLGEILERLNKAYCGSIGSEYLHITDTEQKRWIQQRIESAPIPPAISNEKKQWLLSLLTAAEGLEKYLHSRYVGQKRFSLEGGESLIPLLDELIQYSGEKGINEVVIGMAHRGRLNVLTNILGKPPQEIFDEFEGRVETSPERQAGDVKYHMGFSTDIDTPGGIMHVALGFNPSHLEIIDPVIEGSVRARQRRRRDTSGERVLPVLVHGDSAFAGQGVVMETLNLSQTRGFSTGGTIHIITNNQIGFTTSNPLDTRSTTYCTDVAKMIQAPIFHVNGDDPEAVLFITQIALDFRMHFHKDVVIDMVCYRRHGHNEADEPSVTQPQMYKKIRNHPTVRTLYADKLIGESVITAEIAQSMENNYRDSMDEGYVVSRPVICA